MNKWLLLLSVLICTAGFSQSIVNTEKAMPTTDDKFHLSSNFMGSNIKGNINISLLNIDVNCGVSVDSVNIIRALAGINMLSTNKNLTNNIGFLQLRYNRSIAKNIKTFTFTQVQYNNILLLKTRFLLGSGLRFEYGNDSSIFKYAILLGGMYEYESLDTKQLYTYEEPITRYYRTATSLSMGLHLNKLNVLSTTYYQARFSDFTDVRILNDTELSVLINSHIAVIMVMEYRYDSKPPQNLQPVDYTNSLGIRINM
jgi:hypothetical protein